MAGHTCGRCSPTRSTRNVNNNGCVPEAKTAMIGAHTARNTRREFQIPWRWKVHPLKDVYGMKLHRGSSF